VWPRRVSVLQEIDTLDASILSDQATGPIAETPAMVSHRQNQYFFPFKRINEGILKGSEWGLSNPWSNLLSRLRKLHNAILGSPNFGKEPPA